MTVLKKLSHVGWFTSALLATQVLAAPANAPEGEPSSAVPAQASEPIAVRMTVAVDPETGQLRPATAAESALLASSRLSVGALSAPMGTFQRAHVSGARGARLTDELQHLSVVQARPDGTLYATCIHASAEEAALAHRALPQRKLNNTLPTE